MTHTPEELAQQAADAINPALFEPAIRKAADDFYEQLMTGVQDYLKDNVEFNLAIHITTLNRENATMRPAFNACANIPIDALEAGVVAELVDALRRCNAMLKAHKIDCVERSAADAALAKLGAKP